MSSFWASGVLGAAIAGVRSVCIGGECYIDLRVVVAVGVAGCIRAGVVLVKILAGRGVVVMSVVVGLIADSRGGGGASWLGCRLHLRVAWSVRLRVELSLSFSVRLDLMEVMVMN